MAPGYFKPATVHDLIDFCAQIAAEAAFEACDTAVLTLGGMGYAAEYHVERYLRECMIARIAPVSPHLILNYIAERVLGLPAEPRVDKDIPWKDLPR